MSIKALLGQPLLHFFLIGVVLFVAYAVMNRKIPDPSISSDVVVTEDDVVLFMQSKAPGTKLDDLRQQLDSMGAEERQSVIEDYLRLEIYYREAATLRLDAKSFAVKEQMAREFEALVRSGFEKLAGDRAGKEREQFFQERMADAWSQIESSYNVKVMMRESNTSRGAANEQRASHQGSR